MICGLRLEKEFDILVSWLVGSVLAWTGASTLSELGTAIPGETLLRQYPFITNKPRG